MESKMDVRSVFIHTFLSFSLFQDSPTPFYSAKFIYIFGFLDFWNQRKQTIIQ